MSGDTDIIRRSREWREWGTFILSALAVVAIPVGALILNNQRYQMRQEADDKYVPKTEYKETITRMEGRINSTNEKLDTIHTDVVHLQDSVQSLERTLIGTTTTLNRH